MRINIFSEKCSEPVKFYAEVGSILLQYESGTVALGHTNKALLVTCGDHFTTLSDAMERYSELRIDKSLETVAKNVVESIPNWEDKRILCIKEVRDATGWGLKESKVWCETNYSFRSDYDND